MALGIRNFFRLAADQTFTSNATPATITGFSFPVAVGQIVSGKVRVLATLGATGGLRAQISVPGTGDKNTNVLLADTVTPAVITAASLTAAAFTNALAVAGNHFMDFEFSAVIDTAGTFAFQMAQNTSTADTLTIQAGTWMDVTIL